MIMNTLEQRPGQSDTAPPSSALVTKAWLSLLLLPVALALAFLVGEGLVSLLGYEVGAGGAPWWVAVVATVPALLVFWVPGVLATHFARAARARGDRRGLFPAGIALAVCTAFTLMNLLAPLLGG